MWLQVRDVVGTDQRPGIDLSSTNEPSRGKTNNVVSEQV